MPTCSALYDQNKEAFRTPERVKARHILLKTQGKPASEEAAIKAKGESLLKQIKGGADFAKLAKENSEDPGIGRQRRRSGRLDHARTDGAGVRQGDLRVEAG